VVGDFVEEYNTHRLHSAIGYVAPQDRLDGRHTQIWEARDRKLGAARARRAARREQARAGADAPPAAAQPGPSPAPPREHNG
jgi:hypothetical protein